MPRHPTQIPLSLILALSILCLSAFFVESAVSAEMSQTDIWKSASEHKERIKSIVVSYDLQWKDIVAYDGEALMSTDSKIPQLVEFALKGDQRFLRRAY